MALKGEKYRLLFTGIGYNANSNFDAIPAQSLVTPSKNVRLDEGGIAKRGGTAHVNTNAITSTPDVNSIFDYRKLDGTRTIIGSTSNGYIWKDIDGTAVELSRTMTQNRFSDYVIYNNFVYMTSFSLLGGTDNNDVPQIWNGAALSTKGIGTPNNCVAALAGAGAGNVDNGTHSYKIAWYNASGQTTGGYKSNVITVADKTANGKVALTSIDLGPAGTTGRVVYRTVAGDTGDYKVVVDITNNTDTTYTDNIADASLGASINSVRNTFQTVPTDWNVAGCYPRQIVKHGFGNSERLWCFATPRNMNKIYYTPNNDSSGEDDFSQSTIGVINIETGDGYGIIAGVEYQDRLLAFGKRKAYIIDDSSTDENQWGYIEAGWDGGAASHRLITKTPNDIICMMDDGEIYSVTAVQSYGDYKLASISRPHYIHNYIKDNIDLTKIAQFHSVYDPKTRAVRFFMVRTGQTECDTCLTYYIDLSVWGPPEDNLSYASGYNACSSAMVKESTGDYNIWTGDYSGFVWKLNQSTKSDNGNGYSFKVRTPHLSFESADDTGLSMKLKTFMSGRIIGAPKGDYSISIQAITDGNDSNTATIDMGDSTTTFDGLGILDEPFDIGLSGKRLAFDISNSTAGNDYFFSGMDIFFKSHGEQDNLYMYPSGMAWSQINTGSYKESATYDSTLGLYCAINSLGSTLVSSDGVTCESSLIPATYPAASWTGITSDGTAFYAIGHDYAGTEKVLIAKATDGETWTIIDTGHTSSEPSQNWKIKWNGATLCAVGRNTRTTLTSADGTTWAINALSLPSTADWSAIDAMGTTFCVVSTNSSTAAATGTNGIAWTSRTLSSAQDWNSVGNNGTVFCAVCPTLVSTSTNGATWAEYALPTAGGGIAIAWNGTVLAVPSYTSDVIFTSPTGAVWAQRTLPPANVYSCIAGKTGQFMVFAIDSVGAVS